MLYVSPCSASSCWVVALNHFFSLISLYLPPSAGELIRSSRLLTVSLWFKSWQILFLVSLTVWFVSSIFFYYCFYFILFYFIVVFFISCYCYMYCCWYWQMSVLWSRWFRSITCRAISFVIILYRFLIIGFVY